MFALHFSTLFFTVLHLTQRASLAVKNLVNTCTYIYIFYDVHKAWWWPVRTAETRSSIVKYSKGVMMDGTHCNLSCLYLVSIVQFSPLPQQIYYLFIYLFTCLSGYFFIYLFTSLFIYLFIYLVTFLFSYLLIYIYTYISQPSIQWVPGHSRG